MFSMQNIWQVEFFVNAFAFDSSPLIDEELEP